MLTTANSKEAKSGSLTIVDFEESTVSEMLKFCYTGDLREDGVPRMIELLLLVSLKSFTPFVFHRNLYSFPVMGRLTFRFKSKDKKQQ